MNAPSANCQPTVSVVSDDFARRWPSAGHDNRVPDPDTPRSGDELVPLRRMIDDEVRLEPPRLEPLMATEEAQAAELLAALFATAARHRAGVRPQREAA